MTSAPLSAYAKPGLMLSQVWPESSETAGDTLRALQFSRTWPCFEIYHMVHVPYAEERAAIGAIVREHELDVTCGLSRVAHRERLNLSSLDESRRLKAVQGHAATFDAAREMGARYVQVNSGPAPSSEDLRQEALLRLCASLHLLAQAAAPDLTLLIEPLDVLVHKKGSLGYVPEAVALCAAVPALGLCVDTAHMTLNQEAIHAALPQLRDYTHEFHFCNCVVRPDHPLYGDHHVPFGPPGALDVAEVGGIMAESLRIGLLQRRNRPRVFCEVRRTEGQSPEAVMQHTWNVLESGWEIAQAQLALTP